MPFCTNCGHDNPSGSNFCARCGEPVQKSQSSQKSPASAGSSAEPEAHSGDTTRTIPAVTDDPDHVDLAPEEEAAVKALPRGSSILIVRRGDGAESRYLVNTDKALAGRSPDSEIFLDDITVSRKHVELQRSPEGMLVRDVGSLNGTYVNRKLIEEQVLLQAGDELQIGKFRLVYYPSVHGLD
ncbi:MAG: FHA domain-containing protein [Propionibacteriaceae bacterium]